MEIYRLRLKNTVTGSEFYRQRTADSPDAARSNMLKEISAKGQPWEILDCVRDDPDTPVSVQIPDLSMEQGIRQIGRLSARARKYMYSTGGGMLLVLYYVSWRYMASEEFLVYCLTLLVCTLIGTVVGYFLVQYNPPAIVVSAGCTTILLIIAQFLKGATKEEFMMWWPLAIFIFFIYSFAATLVAFAGLDECTVRNNSGSFKSNQYVRQEESLDSGGRLYCPKCDSLNIRSNRPWWGFLLIGELMFFIKKYNCSDCGHSFSHGASMPKIDSTKSPSKEEIIEKWKGTPGMDHIRKK